MSTVSSSPDSPSKVTQLRVIIISLGRVNSFNTGHAGFIS